MKQILRIGMGFLCLGIFVLGGQTSPPAPAPGSSPQKTPTLTAEPLKQNSNLSQTLLDERPQAVPGTGTIPGEAIPGEAIPGGANIAIIRIEGMIYGFTLQSLERRVQRAMKNNATLIVIELDTPGGVVTSALDIAKYIKGQINVPTVAWINDQAYSAGILIASACDRIVMSPASTTGDCAPIIPGQDLAPTERAKALSPILEEFRDNARNNGYAYAPFHAMCVLGVEVYLIEHKTTGKQMLVNQIDKQFMVDGHTGKSFLGNLFAAKTSAAPGQDVGSVSRDLATDEDLAKWKLVRKIHDGKTLLTLNQTRAVEIKLAESQSIRTANDLKKHLGAASVMTISQTWSEDLAGWLTSPAVRAVLVLALLLGGYIEMQSPGLGVPGAMAVTALILLLGSPFLIGLAEVWHVLLVFVGVSLLLVEVFATPGFGILGVCGLVSVLLGLTLSVIPTGGGTMPLPPPEMYGYLQTTTLWMMFSIILACVGFFFITRYFGNIPGLNRMILQPVPNPVGLEAVAGNDVIGQGTMQVGATGRAISQLRPVGQAMIDGQQINVITQGDWIDINQAVRVIEVHGNRIVVEPA